MLSARFVALTLWVAGAIAMVDNPFTKYRMHVNQQWRDETALATQNLADKSLTTASQNAGQTPTFLWLDTISAVGKFEGFLQQTQAGEMFPFVVYDLPGRDCHAKASNGELATGQLAKYKSDYIDAIVAILKRNPSIPVVAVIEPDSLPNLTTNINDTRCANAASEYREGVSYALRSLGALSNVVGQYIDAGHGGWLGWNDNVQPGAKELASAITRAGTPANVRGFASNVAGWNAVRKVPGEFENSADGQWNKAHDEERYVNLMTPALASAGFSNAHWIIDTGRNAIQGLRLEWGDWCNVNGAGFGVRPTSSTGITVVDSFVWVKPGGESDGTSNTSAVRYDSFCGNADAYKPAPEAGQWNQPYYEMLLKNSVDLSQGTPTSVPTTTRSTTTSRSTSTSTRSTSTSTRSTSNPGGCSVSKYGQCGGSGYSGCTVCASGSTCTRANDWYSQCL